MRLHRPFGLTPAELDQFADAFLTATGVYFRPRMVLKGEGAKRKIRRRRDDEGDDLTAHEGEGETERLKRVLEACIQDRADANANALMLRPAGLATTQLAESMAKASAITQVLEDHRRLARIIDPMPGITAAMKAIQTPDYTSLTEAMKPSPAMKAIREMFAPPNGLMRRSRPNRTGYPRSPG